MSPPPEKTEKHFHINMTAKKVNPLNTWGKTPHVLLRSLNYFIQHIFL